MVDFPQLSEEEIMDKCAAMRIALTKVTAEYGLPLQLSAIILASMVGQLVGTCRLFGVDTEKLEQDTFAAYNEGVGFSSSNHSTEH